MSPLTSTVTLLKGTRLLYADDTARADRTTPTLGDPRPMPHWRGEFCLRLALRFRSTSMPAPVCDYIGDVVGY